MYNVGIKPFISAAFLLNNYYTILRGTEQTVKDISDHYTELNELYDIILGVQEGKCCSALSDLFRVQAECGGRPVFHTSLLKDQNWTDRVIDACYNVIMRVYSLLTSDSGNVVKNTQTHKTLMLCLSQCLDPRYCGYTLSYIGEMLCIYRDRLIHFGTCPYCGAEMTLHSDDVKNDVHTWDCTGCGGNWSEGDVTFKELVLRAGQVTVSSNLKKK